MSEKSTSNVMDTLNSILNNNKIPDNMKEILKNINNTENQSNTSSESSINSEMLNNFIDILSNHNNEKTNAKKQDSNNSSSIDIEMIMKMKTIIDKVNNNKDDPRANLLKSLKPYLKESRKEKIDQYIKLFNMSKVMEVFNSSGGDKEK